MDLERSAGRLGDEERAPRPGRSTPDERPYAELTTKAIVRISLLLVLAGVLVAGGLIVAFGDGRHDAQLEAIKTAGTFVVGLGGGAALWLTARRQRANEIGLNQKHRDQLLAEKSFALQGETLERNLAHQRLVSAAAEDDARVRRITELYARAADQLGSDKAPVRLASMYALERLAQDNVEQRQMIVDVLCAYLRMPCSGDGEWRNVSVEEREVRRTVQTMLARHLNWPADIPEAPGVHWSDIDVDLAGAVLHDFSLADCRAGSCTFSGAVFIGHTDFSRVRVGGGVRFKGTRFDDTAWFTGAEFGGDVRFDRAIARGDIWMSAVSFGGDAWFDGLSCERLAWFSGARFNRNAVFARSIFVGLAGFSGAEFGGLARFDGAEFRDDATFRLVTFGTDASFVRSTFSMDAWFSGAHFSGDLLLDDATFCRSVRFDQCDLGSGSSGSASPNGASMHGQVMLASGDWIRIWPSKYLIESSSAATA
ncbi:pentapeptide repeat-containing protein [Kutzneria buriramensis]|uniref:Pentapeptide repeat protein n=1 Tax=Kutzneria buriramensis TaxID=1045776 RepID=A0A3E0GVJ0_9PSEU|nr:pentapeptide repeat-containing protein [Kutzneria buriramensis]REH30679.1 pentapeptide repeat protein [Kutzneria buriramensis]